MSQPRIDFTPREREVFALIANGAKAKECGHRLGISHRTVKAHCLHMKNKVGARNVVDLVRIVMSERT